MIAQRRLPHAWLDSLVILLLAAALIWPLFRLKYLDNWPSIESTFIADGRMLNEQLPHPGWQPLWYCGTRFDYIYPPALRYGTALIARAIGSTTARSYHLYTAIYYVLGIVAAYWLVRIGSGSRIGAILSAAGVALVSPSFLLLPIIRKDSAFWTPQRLHVLMGYGEGPHISAVCALPAALALTFLALRSRRPAALAGAAVFCALVVSNNFYGATSLAIFFPLVVWAVWVGEPRWSLLLRAAAIPVLAYALCAFWLTPAYLKITTVNLHWVSQPGNIWSEIIAAAAIAVFCAVSWHVGKRTPDRAWAIFVYGAAFLFSLDVLGFYYFGFRVVGEPPRLIPELDLVLILAVVELARTLWDRRKLRAVAVLLAIAFFSPAVIYLRHAYFSFPKANAIENRYEYLITKWVHDHLPQERVMATGTVRFWFNAWFDNAQLDGGSAQGMQNQVLPPLEWQVTAGNKAEPAVLWLQASGTDAVIVPDKKSLEWYHDFTTPEKFYGALPVLFDDQHGTLIYRVPRRFPGIGRIVDGAKIEAVGPIRDINDIETLKKYVDSVDSVDQQSVSVEWKGFDEVHVRAQTAEGQSVLLQESYDPAWRAFENGRPLSIRRESHMNFMFIETGPGDHQLDLRFETPLENRVGQGVFLFGLAAVAILFFKRSQPVTASAAPRT